MSITEAVPLASLTTLRLGGPARRLIAVDREDELVRTIGELDDAGEPLLVLAGGSNVVIADAGFDGTVVHVQTRGVAVDGATLTVQAGEPWDVVVARTVAAGLAGLECLSGIPGSTGATPIQNVGAYGQDVSQTISAVRVLDRATGHVEELAPEALEFRYRTSALKGRDDRVVLAVRFALRESAASEPIAYAELARTLGVEVGATAPVADVRAAVLGLRRGKGMVVDPADPDSVSAGSFFTNPILDPRQFAELERRVAPERPPAFPEPDGRTKVSAAWLIEHAGFERGLRRGPVGISAKHTLALVNRGGAATADLVALAREVAGGVEDAFGVRLQPEPVFGGHAW
jgi:UDP-N-acetylmuramate dehydrogenase